MLIALSPQEPRPPIARKAGATSADTLVGHAHHGAARLLGREKFKAIWGGVRCSSPTARSSSAESSRNVQAAASFPTAADPRPVLPITAEFADRDGLSIQLDQRRGYLGESCALRETATDLRLLGANESESQLTDAANL
jgi:hypothetical protein